MLDLLETKKVHRINGRDGYKVRCPKCGCKGGGFGISRNQDTFILMSSNDSCLYRENLNQLVNRLGDDEMKKAIVGVAHCLGKICQGFARGNGG